jgi:dihydroorotate dehydrogenase (fumarate)
MEEYSYESISDMKGSLSQKNCPDPSAFERANYMKMLKSYVI